MDSNDVWYTDAFSPYSQEEAFAFFQRFVAGDRNPQLVGNLAFHWPRHPWFQHNALAVDLNQQGYPFQPRQQRASSANFNNELLTGGEYGGNMASRNASTSHAQPYTDFPSNAQPSQSIVRPPSSYASGREPHEVHQSSPVSGFMNYTSGSRPWNLAQVQQPSRSLEPPVIDSQLDRQTSHVDVHSEVVNHSFDVAARDSFEHFRQMDQRQGQPHTVEPNIVQPPIIEAPTKRPVTGQRSRKKQPDRRLLTAGPKKYSEFFKGMNAVRDYRECQDWYPPLDDLTLADCEKNLSNWVDEICTAMMDLSDYTDNSTSPDIAKLVSFSWCSRKDMSARVYELVDTTISFHKHKGKTFVGRQVEANVSFDDLKEGTKAEVSTTGRADLSTIRNFAADRDLSCRQRLEAIRDTLKHIKACVKDLLGTQSGAGQIWRLVKSPSGVAWEKRKHIKNNNKRAESDLRKKERLCVLEELAASQEGQMELLGKNEKNGKSKLVQSATLLHTENDPTTVAPGTPRRKRNLSMSEDEEYVDCSPGSSTRTTQPKRPRKRQRPSAMAEFFEKQGSMQQPTPPPDRHETPYPSGNNDAVLTPAGAATLKSFNESMAQSTQSCSGPQTGGSLAIPIATLAVLSNETQTPTSDAGAEVRLHASQLQADGGALRPVSNNPDAAGTVPTSDNFAVPDDQESPSVFSDLSYDICEGIDYSRYNLDNYFDPQ